MKRGRKIMQNNNVCSILAVAFIFFFFFCYFQFSILSRNFDEKLKYFLLTYLRCGNVSKKHVAKKIPPA